MEFCSSLTLLAQCAHVVVPEATEEAMRYYRSGNILWMAQLIWAIFIPLLFLFTGFSGKLASFSERWGRKWFFAIALYLILFVPLTYLLNLPLDFYAGYIREHQYGFSTQNITQWFNHYFKGILVSLVGALAFVWIFYLLLKKSPRRWWIYSSFVSSAIFCFVGFIQPIWVAPLFNQFGPMQDKQLEQKILNLANRAGISGARVFEVNKSQETKTINAYVTGIGATSRIVLWDTAIDRLNEDELLFVMGHEMGHYVLRHIWWQLLYFSLLSFLVFYLTYKIGNRLLHKYHQKFGFSHFENIASLPLFIFILTILSFLSDPLTNVISRVMEHQADRFGLEITQNNQAAGEAFLVLQRENLANPEPGFIYRLWRSSHPPLKERVDFCNSYCPWNDNEPLVYKKYFKEE